jgi:WD40 repeat protein
MLASGSQDKTVRLWNLTGRREVLQLSTGTGVATSLAFSPDGRTLAVSIGGSAGKIIRLVDVNAGTQSAELRGHWKNISSLAFTHHGQTLLSASDDGTVRVWDVVQQAKQETAQPFAQNSISTEWRAYGPALFLAPDGRHLITVYTDQTFSLWDTLRLAEGERHPLPFTNTTTVAVAPGGNPAAFGSRDGKIVLWDAGTRQARFFDQPSTSRVHRLVFSRDGRFLAAADDTKTISEMASGPGLRRTIRVWELGTRKKTHVFTIEGELPVSVTFSADAKALMAGGWKGSVKLWPLDRQGQVTSFSGHSHQAGGVALLPDGKTMVSAGGDVRFWSVQSGRETDQLNPRTSASRIAISPDGRRLATAASDGSISIWDTTSHQEVAPLDAHAEAVRQLAFTPDGNDLVSVSKDQLHVWHAASWAEIEAAEKGARK